MSCVTAQEAAISNGCNATGGVLWLVFPLCFLSGCQSAFWHVMFVPNIMVTCCPASLPAARALQRAQAVHSMGKSGVAARAHWHSTQVDDEQTSLRFFLPALTLVCTHFLAARALLHKRCFRHAVFCRFGQGGCTMFGGELSMGSALSL